MGFEQFSRNYIYVVRIQPPRHPKIVLTTPSVHVLFTYFPSSLPAGGWSVRRQIILHRLFPVVAHRCFPLLLLLLCLRRRYYYYFSVNSTNRRRVFITAGRSGFSDGGREEDVRASMMTFHAIPFWRQIVKYSRLKSHSELYVTVFLLPRRTKLSTKEKKREKNCGNFFEFKSNETRITFSSIVVIYNS